MADAVIIETGNGGDLVLRGNDLALIQGIENKPYLALFGGDKDWWANDFENPTSVELIWTSETESMLNNVTLNSAGRIKIEQAILDDLAILKKQTGSQLKVSTLVKVDRIEIVVKMDNLEVAYVWNPATEQLTHRI